MFIFMRTIRLHELVIKEQIYHIFFLPCDSFSICPSDGENEIAKMMIRDWIMQIYFSIIDTSTWIDMGSLRINMCLKSIDGR